MDFLNNVRVRLLPEKIAGLPEVKAMLGAMYSRSTMPIDDRLKEFDDYDALKDKLSNIVIGYGHESVLDMADVAIFIEEIPILAAVAIEDHALFAGQETSTRYVDWSTGEFVNPYRGVDDKVAFALDVVYDYLRQVYITVSNGVQDRLTKAFGAVSGDVELRAIRARSFDVARGFLPCGAVTNVCWSGRLSSILKQIGVLAIHPDPAIRAIAKKIHATLHENFPRIVPEAIKRESHKFCAHYWPGCGFEDLKPRAILDAEARQYVLNLLRDRERGERVPPSLGSRLSATLSGSLDFGSWRDLNRHRVGNKDSHIPRLFTANPLRRIHPWYIEQAREFLPDDFDAQLGALNTAFSDSLRRLRDTDGYLSANEYLQAHAVTMGTEVPVQYRTDFGQVCYLLELRTILAVHPTLRHLCLEWHNFLQEAYGRAEPVPVFVVDKPDPGRNGFVMVRGKQTITINGEEIA